MDRLAVSSTLLTIDTDWAPDVAIDFMADHLRDRRVKATWFVTHASAAIDRLRRDSDLFEIGVHPNFLPGSSHGSTVGAVLAFCEKLVPGALSMRTHALVQSTPIFEEVLRRTSIRCDASLLLPHARGVQPVEYQCGGNTLLRVPYVWEDDMEMLRDAPTWRLGRVLQEDGLRVFDFHPIHVFLNSADMNRYERLKTAVSPLSSATRETMEACVHLGEGSRTAFVELVDHLAVAGGGECMRDIYTQWKGAR